MKPTAKQYAESLYQAVRGKKDSEVRNVIKNFVKVLISNNDISQADKIIKQFEKIWDINEGVVEAEVVSAKELDNKIVKLLNGYIAELAGAKKVLLKQRVDKDILGGTVIKYGDRVLDGSLKTRLLNLKKAMAK